MNYYMEVYYLNGSTGDCRFSYESMSLKDIHDICWQNRNVWTPLCEYKPNSVDIMWSGYRILIYDRKGDLIETVEGEVRPENL